VFDYAKYRAPEVNASQFWNIRFDRGASRALTSLATTGIVGTLAWALVAFYLAWSAGRRLLRADDETWHLLIAVFAGWTALLVARFTYSSSMTLEYAFWMMLAALVMAHRQEYASFRLEKSPRAALAVSFLFIGGLIVSLAGAYVVGTRYYAETAYAKAVKLSMTDGASEDVVKALESAVDFNGHNDVYLRNLSQAYLGQAQVAIGSVSGEDQQAKLEEMSKFAEGAIGAAKSATVAAPNNVANWSMLGSVYQALIGVSEGADEWAIKSFEKAIELEPSNPEHHAQIGLVHMVLADLTLQAAAQSQDEEAKTKAKGVSDESLGKATEFFERAITLKADYAPAHYQLSLALDRMGKLKEAIIKMEQAIVLGPQDMGARFQLALLYYRDERKTDALALLESVVQTEPKFSNARWYLAALYEEMGRIDDAIAQIDEVAKLNPDSDAVSQKQADLAAKKTGGEGLPEPVEEGVENSNEPGI
jgi:tetratricopeptide (TPR) repeat protein